MKRNPLSRMLKERDGAMLTWFAISLPVILVLASLAIDMAYGFFTRAKLQTTASSAALAGATRLIAEPVDEDAEDAMKAAVLTEAQIYGTNKNDGLGLQGSYLEDADVVVGNWNEAAAQGAEFTADLEPFNAVRVTTRRSDDNALGLLLATAIGEIDVNTTAVATLDGGGTVGPVCLLLLDPTGGEALRFNGGILIESENCGICVNSSAPDALRGNGTSGLVDLDLTEGGESGFVHVHGQTVKVDTTIDPEEEINKPICANPYEVPPPSFADRFANDDCSMSVDPFTVGDTTIFPAGVHCATKNNGDLQIENTDFVLFEAGIHHFIGEDADPMKYKDNGGIVQSEAPGVTFLLTNTEMNLGGGQTMDLQANSVDGHGFLFYQNPADPAQNVEHTLHGNVDSGMVGIQYFGHQNIIYNGNISAIDTSPGGCTVIVAERALFDGGGNGSHFFDTSGCSDQDPPIATNELFYRLVN